MDKARRDAVSVCIGEQLWDSFWRNPFSHNDKCNLLYWRRLLCSCGPYYQWIPIISSYIYKIIKHQRFPSAARVWHNIHLMTYVEIWWHNLNQKTQTTRADHTRAQFKSRSVGTGSIKINRLPYISVFNCQGTWHNVPHNTSTICPHLFFLHERLSNCFQISYSLDVIDVLLVLPVKNLRNKLTSRPTIINK
jgi:hypothetical protein